MKEEIGKSRFNRLINHGPVLLLSTEGKGRSNVMAIAWYAPVSHDPPLVGVAVSPGNYSHRLIEDGGEFVLNVPTRKYAAEVHFCGTTHGSDLDKFRESGLTPTISGIVRAPHIEECIGHIECRVMDVVGMGDHSFFISDVELVVVESDLFDDVWRIEDDELLTIHHLGSDYYATVGNRIRIGQPG